MRASLKDLEVTQVSQDVTFLLCQLTSKYSKYRGSCQALGNLSDLPLAPRVSAGRQTQGSSRPTVCGGSASSCVWTAGTIWRTASFKGIDKPWPEDIS